MALDRQGREGEANEANEKGDQVMHEWSYPATVKIGAATLEL